MADVKKTAEEQVQYDPQYILQVKDLKKYFPIKGGMLNKTVGYVKAVDGVTFNLKRGTTMGLVGESGCGKTTTGRTILRLSGEKTGGQVLFNGQEVYDLNAKEMRDMRTKMQIIFQDPFSSLQPRMPVGEIIGEAVREHGLVSKEEFDDYIDKVMDDCGLQSFHKDRYPHEFSGGQRQRICIARALALKPEFIVCDEPVSALDVSIQAQIINLLKELQEQYKFTYLFISHDLSVVEHISDTVGVMYLGNLVEYGATDASPALCDAIAAGDQRFVALHQTNSGVCAARTAGVREGRALGAKWFAFCDADDLYHPEFLDVLYAAVTNSGLPLACCRYDTFTDTVPADAPAPCNSKILRSPAHLDALLHDHAVDYGLWNKLFSADLLTEEMLDNGLAYNEDLLANWRAFLAAPGCAFCDFAGYHYRQHAASASHRALPPQSIDDQRRAAAEIRATAPAEMQQSVNAFYYEKLVYLASMILRRANAADYRVQLNELKIGIAAGADDPQLGRNPLLPRSIRFSAWLTLHMPRLWQWACRNFLKDRQ